MSKVHVNLVEYFTDSILLGTFEYFKINNDCNKYYGDSKIVPIVYGIAI